MLTIDIDAHFDEILIAEPQEALASETSLHYEPHHVGDDRSRSELQHV